MVSLNEIQQHLTAIVFNDEATIKGLLHVVIAFAVLWFIVFAIVKAVIRKLIGPNPKWLIHAIDKDYERGGKKTLSDLQINMTKSEYITFALRDWPRLQVCRHCSIPPTILHTAALYLILQSSSPPSQT